MLDNAWINGISVLLINLGSGYATRDVQVILQKVFEYKLMKWLVYFTICFTATKNIYISLCISFLIVIFFWHFLNEKSDFNIISEHSRLMLFLKEIETNL